MSDKTTPGLDHFDMDEVAQRTVNLRSEVDKLTKLASTINDEVTKFKDEMISKGEFTDRLEKINNDVAGIQEKLETARNIERYREELVMHTDWRSLVSDYTFMQHETGEPFNEVDMRAHKMFQMPVNYEKMERGDELRNIRNLHDAVLIIDAQNRFRKGQRYQIEHNKLWQDLIKAVKPWDEKLAHAMAGGSTGYGAEWLPTEFSSEFNAIVRITPSLSNEFPRWVMGKGSDGRFPFQNGTAVCYKGSEALVKNAATARETNVATGNKLFSPTVFISALITSYELTEDSIVDMVGFIRQELAISLLEGLDSAIINGDTTSPHQDNAEQTVYQTYDVETAFIGLRAMAADDTNTFDAEGVTTGTGIGSQEIVVFTTLKNKLGVLGARNPGECIWVTGVKGKKEMQTALYNEDALGILQYIISGQLPTIDGSRAVISGQYLETLETDGLDGTDADHTSWCCAHTPSFRIAEKRGVMLEMQKDILTQQQAFVATARWDFGKVCASSLKPVGAAINIQHS